MKKQQLQATGFIITDNGVEQLIYREYLNQYGKDETTTPRGIGDRLFIREIVIDTDEEGNEVKEWQVCTWGGNNFCHCGPDFDNEEDADLYYYQRSAWYIQENNWNAPTFYDSIEEAEESIIELLAEKGIDKEVAASIYSKQKRVDVKRAIIAKELKEKSEKEYNERKAHLAIAVPIEADTIIIDQLFIEGVEQMKDKSGNEKSQYSASIMKELLQRNNLEKVNSDFWKVFRILKTKAENQLLSSLKKKRDYQLHSKK